MQDPVDAFGGLLDDFRRYSHGEIIWTEVRRILDDATALHARYQDRHRADAVTRFAMALREHHKDDTLAGCTTDYLWRKLRQFSDQDSNPVAIAYISLLLWIRN